ncbi:hypothetical protein ES708_08169 [subsurface metagenome]
MKMNGYRVTKIPLDKFKNATAITAMETYENRVYVGLTSKDTVLVELDPANDKVRDTGFRFPSKGNDSIHNKIHNSLVRGQGALDGLFFMGHDANIDWDQWVFSPQEFAGGHLYSFNVKTGFTEDLGLVARCNVPHALAIGDNFLFGYTIPDNHLFAYDIPKKSLTDFGNVIGDFCNHNLVCVGKKAFGGYLSPHRSCEGKPDLMKGVYLFVYDHDKQIIQKTEQKCGEADGIYGGNRGLDSWLVTSERRVYGGLADGKLIELNPETVQVTEIGIARPNGGPRLTCLTESKEKIIFGTAGWPQMGLFSFNPSSNEFIDYGIVTTKYKMCYFHGMAMLPDGRIYVGETDSNRPYVYKLEPK